MFFKVLVNLKRNKEKNFSDCATDFAYRHELECFVWLWDVWSRNHAHTCAQINHHLSAHVSVAMVGPCFVQKHAFRWALVLCRSNCACVLCRSMPAHGHCHMHACMHACACVLALCGYTPLRCIACTWMKLQDLTPRVCSNWTHAALSSLKNFMLYLHMCIVSVLFFPIALLSCLYLFLENFSFFGHEKVVKTDNTSYSQSIFSTHLFFGLHGITFLVVWFFCLHSIVNGLNPNYAFVFDRKRFTLRRSGFCLAMVLLVSWFL